MAFLLQARTSGRRTAFQTPRIDDSRRSGLGALLRAAPALALIAVSSLALAARAQDGAADGDAGWDDVGGGAWEEQERSDGAPSDPDPFDRRGFYAGVAGVYAFNPAESAIEDYLEDELGERGSVDIDDTAGLSARVGYRAASWFAAEIQYEWIDRYDVDVSGDLGPGGSALSGKLYDLEAHSLTLNTRWIIPFWRIQPYLLLGAGYSFYDVNRGPLAGPLEAQDDDIDIDGGRQGAFAARAGFGLDVYLTRNVVLMTEATALASFDDFETPDEGAIDNPYYVGVSAGLQYRF